MGSAPARVLLVEEDLPVRRVMRRSFEGAGFQVVEAGDGPAALAAVSDVPFDLLVTEVTLPSMAGARLAGALRKRWPALPVLFVSGLMGVTGADGLDLEGHGPVASIAKPFRQVELLNAMAELLG